MDILKAEIERKRKQLLDKNLVGPEKKYFKREELIKKDEEEYRLKHNQQQQATSNQDTPSTSSASDSVVIPTSADGSSTTTEKILPRKEVIRRLRERGEPITMFGESEVDSFKRLRQIEIQEPEMNRGLRNDFQAAMEQVDRAYLNEMLKSQGGASGNTDAPSKDSKGSLNDVHIIDSKTDIDQIIEIAKCLNEGKPGPNRPDDLLKKDADIIHKYLNLLLELWGKKLNARNEDEKTSMRGKIASATYTQTQTYLKPLFKQLKTGKISRDILRHLVIIVQHLLDREYVKANDTYLQMAIGNAAWPIGVTMVGIHARTGREKIFSQNIAHVLNDETQRKYIQALKRLMTQCQYVFPTVPSKCVEYNALGDM